MARVAGRRTGNQPGVNGGAPAAVPEPKPEAGPPFFDRLREMDEGDWDGHQVYLYRRWPRISKNDQPHYLEVVRHPVDEQYLLEHHGSGRYSLRLNDKRRTIASHVAEVHSLDHPPKVKPEELIDCPENERYFALWPEKKEGGKAAAAASGDGAAAAAVKEIGAIAREAQAKTVDPTLADLYLKTAEARDSLVQKLAESRDKPDATAAEQLSLVTQVLDLVERLQKAKTGDAPRQTNGDPLSVLDKVLGIVEKLNRGTSTTPDPLSSLDKALEVFGKLKNLKTAEEESTGSPAPGPEASTWEKVGALVVRLLEPAMPYVGQAVAQKLMGAPGGPSPTTPTALPGSATTQGESQSSRSAQPAQEPSTATPAALGSSAAANPVDPATAQLSQLMSVLNAYGPQIVEAIAVGEEGAGADFADSVCKLAGELTYRSLANWGKDAWMTAIQAHPIWLQLAHIPEQVERFVTEFVSWGLPQPAEEQETPKEKHRGRRKPEGAGLAAA